MQLPCTSKRESTSVTNVDNGSKRVCEGMHPPPHIHQSTQRSGLLMSMKLLGNADNPIKISGLYRISSSSVSAETLASIEHKDKDKNEMQEGACAQTPTITGLSGSFRPVSNVLMAKVHFLTFPQCTMKSI
jgi:hypothetical protein